MVLFVMGCHICAPNTSRFVQRFDELSDGWEMCDGTAVRTTTLSWVWNVVPQEVFVGPQVQ